MMSGLSGGLCSSWVTKPVFLEQRKELSFACSEKCQKSSPFWSNIWTHPKTHPLSSHIASLYPMGKYCVYFLFCLFYMSGYLMAAFLLFLVARSHGIGWGRWTMTQWWWAGWGARERRCLCLTASITENTSAAPEEEDAMPLVFPVLRVSFMI